MKSLKNYSIPFAGLSLGNHVFDFEIAQAFFDEFEYSLVKKADLKCRVELEKQETMLILDFYINGTVNATCDKCLSEYPEVLDIHEQQIAKFSDEQITGDDEIINLGKNEHEIMLAGLIYEYINVAVPFTTRCNDEGNTPYCDKEMLAQLSKLTENNEQDESVDPRWDALKKFK